MLTSYFILPLRVYLYKQNLYYIKIMVRRLIIRTLTPGPAVVEAALSSRGLPLQCSPHKSAAVMGLPAVADLEI